ncbi:hypothetical protein DVH24_016095 [Malus domestica]|uniref:Uncharacterized protein n=1 Tax=Malus domestica TaxID=3750 RepID=A0A498JEA6_MALDO|nr:hypothetical protein DVH24_016095 [Malus domestica]
MAQLELNKNTTTPNSQPHVKFARPFKFTVPSEVCGVVGHYNDRCPYIKVGLPDNVTEAPKGYEIVTFRGGKRAVRIMFCGCCKMLRDHKIKDCPNKSETAIMNSILKAARPPAALSNGCSENSGGPALSQGSGISEAVDSNSHSGNSVSSNAICNSDDEKIKVEDEMAKNYIVKRKKESNEGNMES